VALKRETRTTTVRLPVRLYEEVRDLAERENERGSRRWVSVNDVIVTAMAAYVKMRKRRQIDAAFEGMADDPAYQQGALRLAEDFEASDWEALRLNETHLLGRKE
jgi:hypothetical protein